MTDHAVTPAGHLQVVGKRGNRKWRAFWHDADGKHSKTLGPAWVKASGRKTARGAIVWHAADGERPVGYLTPDMARDELAQILAAAPRRALAATAGTPQTFAEAAERWYARAEARGRKPSALKDYRQVLDCYLLPETDEQRDRRLRLERKARDCGRPVKQPIARRAPFATTRLRDLTRQDLLSWFADMPLSRTKEKLVMVVRAILKNAHNHGWVRENVALAVERDPIDYQQRDGYEVAEVECLLAATEAGPQRLAVVKGGARGQRKPRARTEGERLADLRDAATVATLALAGLRLGEVLALQWRHIDIDGATIAVERNYAGGQIVSPKGRSRRRVPMQPALADYLIRWRDQSPWRGDDDLVFPSDAGKLQDRSSLRRRYVAAARRAGLEHKPLHSLRHHFARQALAASGDLGKTRDWCGHQDIRTTGGYVKTSTGLADAAILARGWHRDGLERAAAMAVAG